jgi:hypothetical protein
MTDYLEHHFRYPTMNSWNRSTSYACNLKVDRLGLEHELVMKLLDLIQLPEFFETINDLIHDFGAEHNWLWQAGFNGRSGGYLVLYQGELKPSGYKSYCTACGQRNYRSITEGGNICGVCRQPKRVDYPKTHMQITTFPGCGTDDCEDWDEWELWQLKERVRLVQQFDQLADAIVDEALYLAKNYQVEEESSEYPVNCCVNCVNTRSHVAQKTRQVMVPTA